MKITENIYQLKHSCKYVCDIKAYKTGFIELSNIHQLFYAEYGNKNGVAVLVLHGGPGAGFSEEIVSVFDLKFYRVILFDQRGSGKSTPSASIEENNTQLLIEDIEKLRQHLSVDKWLLFGGSWGSTLALLYSQKYAEFCLGFILRGVFLASKKEKHQLWYGMQDSYPECWDKMVRDIPEDSKDQLDKIFLDLTNHDDELVRNKAARDFMEYDLKTATIFDQDIDKELSDIKSNLAITRIFSHYSVNNFFIEEGQILNNINIINHLPLIIVHGRHDNICKAISAYKLHQQWPGSRLYLVQDGGHSAFDPAILKSLTDAALDIKELL